MILDLRMHFDRKRILCAALLTATCAACSLLADLDALTGDKDAGVDAAVPPRVDPARADAAGVPLEGGGGDKDAEPMLDAAAPRLCERYRDAALCVDFESSDALGPQLWTNAQAPNTAGTVSLDPSTARSAAQSARFDLLDAAAGCEYLRLLRIFPGTFSAWRARVSLLATREDYLLTLEDASSRLVLFQLPDTGHLRVTTQNLDPNVAQSVELGLPVFGRWLDVVIDVETQPSPRLRVAVDGVMDAIVLALPSDFTVRNPAIGIGHFCSNEPSTLHVDDVVVELAP